MVDLAVLGLLLDLMILKVFSNLNNSMIFVVLCVQDCSVLGLGEVSSCELY